MNKDFNLDFLNEAAPEAVEPEVEPTPVATEDGDAVEELVDENLNELERSQEQRIADLEEEVATLRAEIININARLTYTANTAQLFMLSKALAPTNVLSPEGIIPTENLPKKPTLADVRPPTSGRRPKNKPLPGYNGVNSQGE